MIGLPTRRAVLGAAALAVLAAPHARAETTRLQVQWFGAQDRARRTDEVLKLYGQRHPDISTVSSWGGSSDYWQRLATEISGGNGPDLFQLEPNSLADWVRRGAVLPLDGLVPHPIDTSTFAPGLADLCAIDGKSWGVPLGLNSFAMIYDADAFAQAKLPPPDEGTSWDQYADLSVELTRALKRDGYWASADGSRFIHALNVWLRQRGKDLFTADGRPAFDVDDAAEWFSYWDKLRRRGGCVPANVAALDQNSIQTMPIVLGKSATTLQYANQVIGAQQVVKGRLAITTYPNGGPGAKPGQFYRPALIWSLCAQSKHPQQAADLANFFVNDPDAVKILGVERGVPVVPKLRELVLPALTDTERLVVAYVESLEGKVGSYPPPPPVNSQQINQIVLPAAADEVAFGRLSVSEGAKKLMADMRDALG